MRTKWLFLLPLAALGILLLSSSLPPPISATPPHMARWTSLELLNGGFAYSYGDSGHQAVLLPGGPVRVDAVYGTYIVVDLMGHQAQGSVDTSFSTAGRRTYVLQDRNGADIRAEIVNVVNHSWSASKDTVFILGPNYYFKTILAPGESWHMERALADTLIHALAGSASVGHAAQGVVK